MSASLLTALSGYLTGLNLLAGYTPKYYRWSDEDLAGGSQIILFRVSGSGTNDNLLQQIDVMLVMVANENAQQTGNERMRQICQALRGEGAPSGMAKVNPLGSVMGPYPMDHGRVAFELTVRCFVSNH